MFALVAAFAAVGGASLAARPTQQTRQMPPVPPVPDAGGGAERPPSCSCREPPVSGTLLGRTEQVGLSFPDGVTIGLVGRERSGSERANAPAMLLLEAKVDSGADRSAIDVSELVEGNETGDRGGEFADFVVEQRSAVRWRFRSRVIDHVTVRSSSGAAASRPVVAIDLCLGGRRLRSTATLTRRSDLSYPMLLGRNALSDGYLVDVRQSSALGPPRCAPR